MATTKKAPCRRCKREITVLADGTLRKHNDDAGEVCSEDLETMIALPWARPPMWQNDRLHHMVAARLRAQTKTEARWAIRAAKPEPLDRADIVLHYRVPDNRIRDTDGPAPTFKAVIDALVTEGVLPADHWKHVPFTGTRFHPPVKGLPPALWITLTIPVEDRAAS